MAINYLNSITLNQNELLQARIENQPNNTAAGSGVSGQIYFNTTDNKMKVFNGLQWVTIGEDSYIEDVSFSGTTLTFTAIGEAFDGGIDLSSLASNATITLAAGTYLGGGGAFTLNQAGAETITFNHDNTTRSNTTSTDAPGYGGTFEAVTSVTTNAQGHVTGVDTSTVTIPASDNTTYDLAVGGGGPNNALVQLVPSSGTTDTVVIEGTTNEIQITDTPGTNGGTVTIGLPNDVTVSNDLTVNNDVVISGNLQVTGTTTTNHVETVSTTNGVVFEGSVADDNELTLLAGTLTADRTVTLPNATGTVALTSDITNAINATGYSATITDTATVTHGLNTRDVIIQLYDATTYETVYADVDRISTTQATITFASTPTNSIRVLVQKIS